MGAGAGGEGQMWHALHSIGSYQVRVNTYTMVGVWGQAAPRISFCVAAGGYAAGRNTNYK